MKKMTSLPTISKNGHFIYQKADFALNGSNDLNTHDNWFDGI